MFDLFFFYMPHHDERKAATNYALMDLMRASAVRVGFEGKFIFYTHVNAKLPNDLPVSVVKRIAPKNVSDKDFMLLKAIATKDFVSSPLFEHPTISVEADQLFQKDPTSVFKLPFDIGLTYTCWSKEVTADFQEWRGLNGGVTYLNNQNIEAVRNYFSIYVDKFFEIKDQLDKRQWREIDGKREYVRLAEWGGGEISHVRLLPPAAFEDNRQERQLFEVGNAKVMLLESLKFNCHHAERQGDEVVVKYYPEAIIRHFSQFRTPAMPPYAEEYLGLRLRPSEKTSWGTEVFVVK